MTSYTLTKYNFTLNENVFNLNVPSPRSYQCCDGNEHLPTAFMNCSFVARLGSPPLPLQHLATSSSHSFWESSKSSDVVEELDDIEDGRTGLQQEDQHVSSRRNFTKTVSSYVHPPACLPA
jgi:hypothetical protein